MVTVIVDKLTGFPRDQLGFAVRLDEATNSKGSGDYAINVLHVRNIQDLKDNAVSGKFDHLLLKSSTVVFLVGFAEVAMPKHHTNNEARKLNYVIRKVRQSGANIVIFPPAFKLTPNYRQLNVLKNLHKAVKKQVEENVDTVKGSVFIPSVKDPASPRRRTMSNIVNAVAVMISVSEQAVSSRQSQVIQLYPKTQAKHDIVIE